ncbi:MAG: nicotinate-nucleotide adenylyltransferase [Anaerolineae bacterium]|nr:nicotinate-nucleotide adenylyltransferase [Anaerolineae bacterium]
MVIGVLGGTFDPIQIAHLMSAEVVVDTLPVEKVFFVPAGDPPHKQGRLITSTVHRRSMVNLAIAANPRFELCPVDLNRPGPHYSVDTVQLIREQNNLTADDCYFIIGGDSLVDLPTWHQPEKLIEICRLVVVHRPGYQPDTAALAEQIPGLPDRLVWVEMPQISIAASQIRDWVKAGRSVRYQVPDEVWLYIQRCGLYQ